MRNDSGDEDLLSLQKQINMNISDHWQDIKFITRNRQSREPTVGEYPH